MPITYEESATTGPRAACRACEGSGHAPGYAVRVPCSACRGNGSNPLRGLDDEADERIDALEAEVDRLRAALAAAELRAEQAEKKFLENTESNSRGQRSRTTGEG